MARPIIYVNGDGTVISEAFLWRRAIWIGCAASGVIWNTLTKAAFLTILNRRTIAAFLTIFKQLSAATIVVTWVAASIVVLWATTFSSWNYSVAAALLSLNIVFCSIATVEIASLAAGQICGVAAYFILWHFLLIAAVIVAWVAAFSVEFIAAFYSLWHTLSIWAAFITNIKQLSAAAVDIIFVAAVSVSR